jgi:predicted TPR repeat methyltransferase
VGPGRLRGHLVYFADLAPVLAAAARGLRPGGLLVFTVERAEEDEAPRWRGCGLTPEQIARADLRIERKLPVAGVVVSASR